MLSTVRSPALANLRTFALLSACMLAGGCASNPLALPPLPPMPALTASLGSEARSTSLTIEADASVDVYARIARGALKCWFGPEGSLKRSHVFHARVDPPASGGGAEIVVHTRDGDQGGPGPASVRAYVVTITPAGERSRVEARNVRFSESEAALMTGDLSRWIEHKEGCSTVGTGGWSASAPPTAAAPAAKKAPAKKP